MGNTAATLVMWIETLPEAFPEAKGLLVATVAVSFVNDCILFPADSTDPRLRMAMPRNSASCLLQSIHRPQQAPSALVHMSLAQSGGDRFALLLEYIVR
jgi:hypothetical protein